MATTISSDDIAHLADLSNLQLTDEESASLRQDLEAILAYISELSDLDTDNVEPTYQVTDLSNVWRDDTKIDSGVDRDALLSLAPSTQDNQVKVPKVL